MARARASTKQRGYAGQHRVLHEQWRPAVDAGKAYCHARICLMPTRWIEPGTPWDLGHTPDRTAWTGPEHRRCNRSDGARRGNAARRPSRALTTLTTSRRW